MRLHTLSLHGWGVICGLIVKPHPHCPEKRLVVTTGLAVDDCGREIRLLRDDCVNLPQPVPGSAPSPAAPMPAPPPATPVTSPEAGGSPAQGQPYTDDDDDGPREGNDPCDPTPVPKDLYLCIRYAECETEFAPAPFDDCSCTTSSQKPNRVCEGYTLELYEQKPSFWDKATEQACEMDDCGLYYRQARECCPETACFPCLPLAIICNFVAGEPVRPEQIDNWGPRRQLASVEMLDQVVRCILTKLPTGHLTRIEDTNWEHNRRLLCREFVEEYVGTAERPRGFRIEFSHHVESAEIDTRTFQALVVFRPENGSEPRHMQIAPARVERDPDDDHLGPFDHRPEPRAPPPDGRSFDLFLSLGAMPSSGTVTAVRWMAILSDTGCQRATTSRAAISRAGSACGTERMSRAGNTPGRKL